MPKESVDGINSKNLKKKCIVFDLEDVLAIGTLNTVIEKEKAAELLEKLSLLETKLPVFSLALVCGFSEDVGRKKFFETGFEKFFKKENVFFADKNYIDSMADVDRERHLVNLEKNAFFQDDYFKQKAIEKIATVRGLERNEIVFVCHDLLTDAFYSSRFSQVDVVLLKDALSLRHMKSNVVVSGLNFVVLDWKQFKKLLLGKLPETDYSFLKRFIENFLSRELVGNMGLTAGLVGKARLLQKQNEN